MKPFLRLLRGARPYRMQIFLSLLCAIGVSVSYASGVATLYPVMKLFMSAEGVHGWLDQQIVRQRLGMRVVDLTSSVRKGRLAIGVAGVGRGAPRAIRLLKAGEQIRRVTIQPGPGRPAKTADSWLQMMSMLSTARAGASVNLITGAESGAATRTLSLRMPALNLPSRLLRDVLVLMPARRIWGLGVVVLAFVALCIVGSLLRYLQTFISSMVANRIIVDLRRRLFRHIMDLPYSYTAQQGTHDLVSRVLMDTEFAATGLGAVLGKAILEPTKSLGVAVLAVMVDWRLFIGMLVILPAMGVVIRKYGKKMMKGSKRQLQGWSDLTEISNEAMGGMRVVKAYGGSGYERRRFAAANRELLSAIRRIQHYMSLSRPLFETLSIILVSIPLMFTADLTFHHLIGKESFFLLLACLIAMFEPLRKLNDLNSKIQIANAAASRCFEILDLPKEANIAPDMPKLSRHRSAIEFEDVHFRYPNSAEWAVNGVSLTVPFGSRVAVVGANGSGKTTLLSLLPRLYLPASGRILIDGVDIACVSVKSLRRQIGLVTQDAVLFSDSIRANIAYGSRAAPEDAVMDAARRSYVDEFVRQLPEGYNYQVGQSGNRLSGGQRQRVALARAILRDPSILILDEATSQIDSDSEAKIAKALEDFMHNRTTFIIAHRFSTVMNADMVVCLDQGRIVGCGTHQQLLADCPAYRRLYESQWVDRAGSPREQIEWQPD